MRNILSRGSAIPVILFAALVATHPIANGQGCVAAHAPQPVISGLAPGSQSNIRHSSGTNVLHGLTVTTGFRVYNSYKHYVGTVYQEQRAIKHNAIVNHVDLFELDLNY